MMLLIVGLVIGAAAGWFAGGAGLLEIRRVIQRAAPGSTLTPTVAAAAGASMLAVADRVCQDPGPHVAAVWAEMSAADAQPLPFGLLNVVHQNLIREACSTSITVLVRAAAGVSKNAEVLS